MDREIRLYIFVGILIGIAIAVLYFYLKSMNKTKAEIVAIKTQYDKAVRNGNKALALELGRKYYSKLRGGNLSIYDEQAITNDLFDGVQRLLRLEIVQSGPAYNKMHNQWRGSV